MQLSKYAITVGESRLNNITDVESWLNTKPPKMGKAQWKDGRSAKELARYITANMPLMPAEIERVLLRFTSPNAVFNWDAEYVTDFEDAGLGRGEGRNHDAAMLNGDVFVGIEGKVDESLGNGFVATEYEKGGENKRQRIVGLSNMIWGAPPEKYPDVRYQLLTASAATLLEAKKHNVKNALFLVMVLKKEPTKEEKDGETETKIYFNPKKIDANNRDISLFLQKSNAADLGDCYKIPTKFGKENGIDLYFKKIEITVK